MARQPTKGVLAFAHRLGRGAAANARSAWQAKSIRGVALGVIVTALVESIIAGLGPVAEPACRTRSCSSRSFSCSPSLSWVPLPVLVPAVIWLVLVRKRASGE